jgi:hypothetical protein
MKKTIFIFESGFLFMAPQPGLDREAERTQLRIKIVSTLTWDGSLVRKCEGMKKAK